jgi:hypothetical protein
LELLFLISKSKKMNFKSITTAIVLAASVLVSASGKAQKDTKFPMTDYYNTAIGLRAGMTSGITLKHFFGGNTVNAIEGIIGIWPDAIGFTGLYERHAMTDVRNLAWYYGGGAHVTGGNSRNYYVYDNHRRFLYKYGSSNFALGIDGIVGAEYKVPQIPFAFSLDVKPMVEINDLSEINMFLDPSIGIKVAF